MDGYVRDYDEGFLGVGYSHPADETVVRGTESHPGSASWSNASKKHQYNDSQPLFVPARITENDADIARSKAKDILSSILQGMDSPNDSKAPAISEKSKEENDDDVNTFSTDNSIDNRQSHNYNGPPDGFRNGSEAPSNTVETTQTQTRPKSSIESDALAARAKALGILHKFQSQPDTKTNTIESTAQVARAKAMGILRKFQSQPNGNDSTNSVDDITDESGTTKPMAPLSVASYYPPPVIYSPANTMHGVCVIPELQEQYHAQREVQSQTPTISATTEKVTIPPGEFAKRRRECLEKEEERKKRALFKNLQYVAKLEEERLAKQLMEVQQVKTLEQQIDERYQQKMEYRIKKRNSLNDGSNNINTSAAGIGTKQRRKAEAKRKKSALPPSLRQKHLGNRQGGKNGSDSVAIYVSNLPTDGSNDETMVRGLFSAYGNLRKIHFYVDKMTGRKKGDALVIYSLTKGEDENALTESVCSQVNGCELPGGSILRVEPSDPYHKVTAQSSNSNNSQKEPEPKAELPTSRIDNSTQRRGNKIIDAKTMETLENQSEELDGEVNKEEDLDDFFASLE